jgi:hypothetical protein
MQKNYIHKISSVSNMHEASLPEKIDSFEEMKASSQVCLKKQDEIIDEKKSTVK